MTLVGCKKVILDGKFQISSLFLLKTLTLHVLVYRTASSIRRNSGPIFLETSGPIFLKTSSPTFFLAGFQIVLGPLEISAEKVGLEVSRKMGPEVCRKNGGRVLS